ncbi:hypothetical protein [[Eubacterium] cellulosolvens]
MGLIGINIKYITVFLIILLVILSGCFGNDDNKDEDDEPIIENEIILSYWYEVVLDNLTGGEVLYIPVVQDYSGNISRVNEDIELTGGSYEIISTEHDHAIKIEGKNSTANLDLLEWDSSKTEIEKIDHPHFLFLSLYVDENQNGEFDVEDSFDYKLKYRFFYNGTSENVTLKIEFGYDWMGGVTYGGTETVTINYVTLKPGWNAYDANYGESHL